MLPPLLCVIMIIADVPNATMAAAVSLNAGMDLNSNTILPDNLDAAIKAGYTTEAVLDAALSRTLTMRFRAGIFDPLETQVGSNSNGLLCVLERENNWIVHGVCLCFAVYLKSTCVV